MKTLRYLVGAASIAMVASFAGAASAATVVGTPHDLTPLTIDAANAQVCVFCHTPHNGAQGGGGNYDGIPLWNRQADGATVNPGSFQTYTSPTLTGVTAGQPSGVSLGCLSCHDGVTAFDSLIVTSEATALTSPGGTMTTLFGGSPAILGGDLRNDHPISITYGTPAADFQPSPTLPLFGAGSDQVECGSCHNPHDNDQIAANASKFLRMSNASSALCLNCHVK